MRLVPTPAATDSLTSTRYQNGVPGLAMGAILRRVYA